MDHATLRSIDLEQEILGAALVTNSAFKMADATRLTYGVMDPRSTQSIGW
jgi:hypothetical protein